MIDKFKVKRNLVCSYVESLNGERIGKMYPASTEFDFVGNTIIADVSKTNKDYNYEVFSFIDDEKVPNKIRSSFKCIEIEKLKNGNLRLRLMQDIDKKERSLILDTVKGKPCSKIYDGMCRVDDGSFLVTYNFNRRGYNFDYYFKINEDGEVASLVVNSYTERKFPYEELVYDENETIKLINAKANNTFLSAHNLPLKK